MQSKIHPSSFVRAAPLAASLQHHIPTMLACLQFPWPSELIPTPGPFHMLCPLPRLTAVSFSSFRSLPSHYPSERCLHS